MNPSFHFRFLLTLGLVISAGTLLAQDMLKPMVLSVNFTKQSPYLSDYSENSLLVSVTNPNARAVEVLLEIGVTSGSLSIKTKPDFLVTQSQSQGIVLPPNQTKVLTSFDLPPGLTSENNLDLNLPAAAREGLIRFGILPEGQYLYCISLYERTPGVGPGFRSIPATNGCKTFSANYIQPPVISPRFCGDNALTASSPQTIPFTWTPAVGAPPGTVLGYDAYVVEIPEGEDPQTFTNQAVELGLSTTTKLNGDRPLPTTQYLYNEAMSIRLFETGKRYGMLVKAVDQVPNSSAYFRNEGKSPVCSFRYGNVAKADSAAKKNPDAYAYKGPVCKSCQVDLPDTTSRRKANLQPGDKVKMGTFTLTIGTLTSAVPTKAAGVGTIGIREVGGVGIPVVVNFQDLAVNSNNEAINGSAFVEQNPNASFLPDFSKPNLRQPGVGDILNIDKFINDSEDNILTAIRTSGFKVPFGLDNASVPGSPLKICITNMSFTPRSASFGAVAALVTEHGSYGLRAVDVCFDKQTLVCGEALLTLAEDTKIDPLNLILFAYKNEQELGTHVVFDDTGFRRLAIHGQVDFPPSVVKQRNGQRATADIRAYSEKGWSDWIADLSFTEFVVTGSEEISFSMKGQKAYYDHSTVRNPSAMPFSTPMVIQGQQHAKEVDVTWEGFYLPELFITLPQFVKDATRPKELVKAEAQNFFIDKEGFTGYVQAQNVLNINNGSLDGWYFSVDKFEMLFVNSSYKGGGLFGKLHLPLVGKGGADQAQKEAKNLFDYTCTLTANKQKDNKLEFEFAVAPRSGLEVGVWLATMELDKNSSIRITNKSAPVAAAANADPANPAPPAPDGDLYVAALLNGKLSIDGDLPLIGKTEIVALTFQGLGITSREPYVDFGQQDVSAFGLNSPQRYAFGNTAAGGKGFPIELKKVHPIYGIAPAGGGISVGIGFEMLVELAKDKKEIPRAEGGFQILSKLGKDPASGRFSWTFDKIKCDSLGVHGKLGPVQVDGIIRFFDEATPNIPKGYGSGLYGNVAAKFPLGSDKIEVMADLIFGNTDFSYFYVNATVGGLSVPIGGPVKLTAFSGGFYYNMVPTNLADLAKSPPGTVKIGYQPANHTMGFKASLRVGSTDGGLLLRATGILDATFNTDQFALKQIRLITQAGMICLNDERQTTGVMNGQLTFDFDLANEVFSVGNAVGDGLHAAFGPDGKLLKGDQRVAFMVDYGQKNWFFKVGEPNDRNTISVLGLFEVRNYFMVGNDLPPFPEPEVNLAQFADYRPLKATDLQADSQSPGLAFGASFHVPSQTDPAHPKEGRIDIGPFFLKYSAGFGFDMMLKKSEQSCDGKKLTDGGEPIGINGWYANGQVWGNFSGVAGIQVDVFFASGEFEIFRLEAAALLQAGLPNPVFMKGYFHGRMDLFDGLITGTVNLKFSFGQECNPNGQGDPFKGVPIIADVRPDGNKDGRNVSIMARPQVAFNFPVNKEFKVNVLDDEGNSKERRLKIVLTKFLVINTKTGQPMQGCAADGSAAGTGNPVFATNGKLVDLADLSAFAPQSDYQIEVAVEAQEWTGSRFETLANGVQTPTGPVVFHTGDCLQSLETDGAVLAAYPFKNQRYLLPGQFKGGMLQLARCGLLDCFNAADPKVKTELQMVFTSYKTGKVFVRSDTVAASASGQTIKFTLPALPNGVVVACKLILKKTYPKPAMQLLVRYSLPASINKQNVYGESSITTKQAAIDQVAVQGGVAVQTLYTYYFGTSTYNTLTEKARYIGNSQNATAYLGDYNWYGNAETVRATVKMSEPFDVFDLNGMHIHDGLQDWFTFPLIDLREPDGYNNYTNLHAQPLLYSLSSLSPKLNFGELRAATSLTIDQLLSIGQDAIPRRPFSFANAMPALSDDEVKQYVPCAYNSCGRYQKIAFVNPALQALQQK